MSYKLNIAAWNGVFVVPNLVVDEHLKKAGGQQLRVLLFLLRHNCETPDPAAVSAGTGLSKADVKDAMQYWIETGLVFDDGLSAEPDEKLRSGEKSPSHSASNPVEKNGASGALQTFKALPDVVPTYDQVAARTLEDENLRALFNEVQIKLGRTIGYGEQSQLLMMLDYYGLPVEVILTVVEYCCSLEKSNMKYISKVAKDWAEKGINTLEFADDHIRELKSDERLWKRFTQMFTADAPLYTEKRFAFLKHWHVENKQSLHLIYYAYEKTMENINKPNFSYMNSILESWKENKIKTPQEAMAAGSAQKTTSYDSDKVKEKARGPIEYKRRESGNGK